jgi:hypothetical protein
MGKIPVLLLLLMTFTLSCSESDEDYILTLVGTWYNESKLEEDLAYRNELIFRADGTFERSLQIINSNNRTILGYLSLATGEYRVSGNILERYNVQFFGIDNKSSYLEKTELLKLSEMNKLSDIRIIINKSSNELTFDYSIYYCTEHALCVDSEKFFRSQ